MSSELFMFENSLFSDPFSPFIDTQFDILQEIQDNSSGLIQENNNNNPLDESGSFDQITSALISSSPPSVQLGSLSLSQLGNTEYSVLEVKTEECQFNFDGFSGNYANSFLLPQSYDESAMKFMQRSYSSNSFENKQNFSFRPQFDGVLESQNLLLSSPEGSFSSGQMRRVCSTGDLQKVKIDMQTRNVLSSSPLSTEKSFMEEANFKVGRYSAEERKERIDRYRAKRTQRNFNKTIKVIIIIIIIKLMDFMKNATKESHEEDRSSTTSAQLSTRIIAIADH
ncbi:hypothetical protein BUALT_Bualt10G0053400 [Buddleja alternifolia]|uniref:CCT domain-containing protein n=1 Tax=Buddleja alternifolia TaxID=168488 RepID=A0AAV6WY04_9LAMI|nr:hypothetical protein BUALT_Bualt10G0053400 [Buddleja alternifolia]